MAAFIAKQMVGDQLKSVKGALGEKKDDEEKKDENAEEEDPEIAEARREAEERRKEKHRKMEEERENMRQQIRDKYGLKKKEKVTTPEEDTSGRIGRKKKTPAELAAEASADSDDELQNQGGFPTSLDDFTKRVSDLPNKVATGVTEVTEKCCLQ